MAQAPIAATHYQYYTNSHAYHFKLKEDQNIILKVYNTADQLLHKQTFTFASLKMPRATLTEETVKNLLPLLVQQGLLPAQYIASAASPIPPPLSPSSPFSQAPSPSPISPSSPSPDTLDPSLSSNLQALSLKSKSLLDAAELSEQQAIKTVLASPQAIEHLILSQSQEDQALAELILIQKQPLLYTYYQALYQKLTGVCLATYTIKSGMVDNAQQNTLGHLSTVFTCAGSLPVAGFGIKIIGSILKVKNIQDNNRAVAHLARFFADLDHSLQNIKTITRLLTRQREKELPTLKPPKKFQELLNTLKEWFTADESTNLIVVKAAEDGQELLTAILTQKLDPNSTPEQIVSHLLGRPLVQPFSPPPISLPSPSSVSLSPTPPLDAASKEQLEHLRQDFESKQKELHKKLQEAERKATLAQAYTEAAFGPIFDLGDKLQLQDHADPTKAVSPGQALLRDLTRTIVDLKGQIQYLSQAQAAAQEQILHVENRQESLEAKTTKKK